MNLFRFYILFYGQQFDLGGGRIVTAYECPGHAVGEMMFLDEQTRSPTYGPLGIEESF